MDLFSPRLSIGFGGGENKSSSSLLVSLLCVLLGYNQGVLIPF